MNKLTKLPSIVYVFLFPLLVAAFIAGIILFFVGLATVEGFGSIVFLIIIIAIVYPTTKPQFLGKAFPSKTDSLGSIGLAMMIAFGALMGACIDQPGNFIYNQPIELIFCEEGTNLNRNTMVSNPLPGRTDYNQDFRCLDSEGETVKRVNMFMVFLIRFVEYVFVIYGVIYLSKLVHWVKGSKQVASKDVAR